MDDITTLQQRPRFSRRGFIGGAAALVMTGGGTAAWALDRFVVEHAEVTDASALWSSTTTSSSSSSGTVNGTIWSSDAGTISITAHTSGSGSSASAWYVADLQLVTGRNLEIVAAGAKLLKHFRSESFLDEKVPGDDDHLIVFLGRTPGSGSTSPPRVLGVHGPSDPRPLPRPPAVAQMSRCGISLSIWPR